MKRNEERRPEGGKEADDLATESQAEGTAPARPWGSRARGGVAGGDAGRGGRGARGLQHLGLCPVAGARGSPASERTGDGGGVRGGRMGSEWAMGEFS